MNRLSEIGLSVDHVCFPFDWFGVFSFHQERGKTANRRKERERKRRQAEWVGELQEQVQRLEESVKDLKPQLGRTEALAEDLKQQVELLRRDYREIAEVLRGV